MPGAPYNDPYPVAVKLQPYPYVDENQREAGRHTDPVGYALSREQRGRERIIAEETVKIVREQVSQCYQREGVNHYQNCKHLTKQHVAPRLRLRLVFARGNPRLLGTML